MRDLFPEAPFRTSSSEVGATTSNSDHNRVSPRSPGDIRTNKHNSLTKSSSWRGAHCLLAYGKYGWPPYYSNKPKANEVWRFENSHCGGRAVPITPSDEVCLSSPFLRKISEKMKPCNSNPEIANAGAPKTRSTPSPSMSAFSPHLHQFRHDLQQQAIPELYPDSRTLLAHIHKKVFFRGTWRLIKMAKWVLAKPTTDTVSAWDEVISSRRIKLFSDIPWNSNTWLSIAGFTCLINLCTHYNFDEFVCQQWSQHDISRNRWGTKPKFPHFKTLLSLTCLHSNTLKFYSLLFNFIKFTIYYENYKEIPSLTERMIRVISILAVTNGHGFQPNISD